MEKLSHSMFESCKYVLSLLRSCWRKNLSSFWLVCIAATLLATWTLLFWPTWAAAVDQTLLLDERSFDKEQSIKRLESFVNKTLKAVSYLIVRKNYPLKKSSTRGFQSCIKNRHRRFFDKKRSHQMVLVEINMLLPSSRGFCVWKFYVDGQMRRNFPMTHNCCRTPWSR